MDPLKLYTLDIILRTVDNFSKVIKTTPAFKYFSESDTQMVIDYKDFNIKILASAMATIHLDLDMSDSREKEAIQTVYIYNSAAYIRKIISGEYKNVKLKVEEGFANIFFKGNIESHLCFQVHILFEQVLEELKLSLKENSAFYFYKYDKPYFNEKTGENEIGEIKLFDYIDNLMLAIEDYDYEDDNSNSKCINYRIYFELPQNENDILNSFVQQLQQSF